MTHTQIKFATKFFGVSRSKTIIVIFMISALTLTLAPVQQANATPAAIIKVIQEGIRKAIKALDLKIQRLQNKTIGLQNAAKVVENKLSKLKLKEIGEWAQRQRDLYKKYYDELWKVRNTVAAYKRIRMIIERQQQMIEDYKFMRHMISQDNHFTRDEKEYMYRVYKGMLEESVNNLDQILLVINSFKTQMTDAKRLEVINKAGDRIDENYTDLRQFNNQNVELSINRAKDAQDINAVRKLYGLDIQ